MDELIKKLQEQITKDEEDMKKIRLRIVSNKRTIGKLQTLQKHAEQIMKGDELETYTSTVVKDEVEIKPAFEK
jgi:hypothetical protein